MATLYFRGTDGIWTTSGNWKDSGGSTGTPASNDTLIFDSLSGSLTSTAGTLNQSALTGITLYVKQEFTGSLGTVNTTTGAATYLQLGTSSADIGGKSGQGSPQGSPRIMLDNGSTNTTITIHDSCATSTDSYLPPIQLKGTSLNVNQLGGSAGVAVREGETSTLVSLVVGSDPAAGVQSKFFVGRGTTVTTINQNAGTIYHSANNTTATVNKSGGTFYYFGTGIITAFYNDSGGVDWQGTGTNETLRNGGTLDFSHDGRAKSVGNTTFQLLSGSSINLNNGNPLSITMTVGYQLVGCGPQNVSITSWPNKTMKWS